MKQKTVYRNQEKTDFDFYDPNNILVLEDIYIERIIDFMQKEFHEISYEVKKKYDVHSWLNKFMPY